MIRVHTNMLRCINYDSSEIISKCHSSRTDILSKLCMLGIFSCFCCRLMTLFKINIFKKVYFRNTIKVSNGLDPDQDQHFVGPDLVSNCLQRL